jgi:ribose transport system permease protein
MHDRIVTEDAPLISPPPKPEQAGASQTAASSAASLLRSQSRNLGLIVALVIAIAIISIPHPGYLSLSNFKVVGLSMAYTLIAALGTAFLMIGGSIDLSIGSNLTLAAVVAALLANHLGSVGAIIVGILVAGLVGSLNGLLVWRVKLSPLIITLGSLTAVEGVVLLLTGGYAVFNVPNSFSNLGTADVLGLPSALAIAIVLIPVAFVILSRTTFGQYTFAIGANRAASSATGLNVRRLVLVTFGVNGLIIGLVGALEASRFASADPTLGTGFELDVITAVILGGVAFTGGEGGIGGIVLAVMLLGVIQSGLVWLNVNPNWSDVVTGMVLIIAVSIDQLAHEQRERYQKMVAMRELADDRAQGESAVA